MRLGSPTKTLVLQAGRSYGAGTHMAGPLRSLPSAQWVRHSSFHMRSVPKIDHV